MPVRPRSKAPEYPQLDDIDRLLVRALAVDARIPNNALASQAGIAPSTCLLRVRRLVDTGVITGFRTSIDPAAVGLPLEAVISVQLQAHARDRIREFGHRCAELPGVLNVFFLAGATDFQIHVAAASPDALRDFVVKNLSAIPGVATTETNLIFEHLSPNRLA